MVHRDQSWMKHDRSFYNQLWDTAFMKARVLALTMHKSMQIIRDEVGVASAVPTLGTVFCTSQMAEQTPQRPEPMERRR